MKTIGKIAKIALITVGSLVGALVVLLLCVLEWPSIALNSHTLHWGIQASNRKAGMPQVSWDGVQVVTRHRGLFSNQVEFDFTNLCFRKPDLGHGCFETLHAALAYGIRRGLPRLTELGPLQARAHEIDVLLTEHAAATHTVTAAPDAGPGGQSPAYAPFIREARIKPVDVRVERWTFSMPNLALAGTYRLALGPEGAGLAVTSEVGMDAKSHALGGALDSTAKISMSAESASDQVAGPWKGQLALDAKSPKLKATLATRASLSPGQGQQLDYRVGNRYVSPLGKANIELAGWAIPGHEVKGDIRGELEPTRSQKTNPLSLLALLQMNRFQLKECRYDMVQPGREDQDGKIHTDCFLDSQIVHFRLYGQEQPPIKLWRDIGVVVTADVILPGKAHSKSPISGRLALAPRSNRTSALQLGGEVRSDFEVMPGEVPVPRKLETAVDLSMDVPSFQKLVKILSDTPVAIPAPLHGLDGRTRLSARGNLNLNRSGKVLVRLGTHLNHAPDHLNVDGDGAVTVEALRTAFDRPPRIPQVDARMNVLLSRIHLTLPKTGLSAPPSQVLPDPRIHSGVPDATSQLTQSTQHGELAGIHYLVTVKTPAAHPIEIASQFLKKPLTVGLDLHLKQGRPWMGFAEVNGNREPVGIPSSQMAGQVADSRTGPKLPFGFSELASSFLTGVPFEAVTTEPKPDAGVDSEQEQTRFSSVLELRRRF